MKGANRLLELRKRSGMTQVAVADEIGVSDTAYQNYEWGKRDIPGDTLKALAALFGTTADYILGITGPVALAGSVGAVPANMAMVPIVGRVHAGPPTEPEILSEKGDGVLIPEFLVEQDPETYACFVEGDCMNRVYPEGCVIAVSPNREPQNGSVAVVSIDGADAVMRRMYRTQKTLVLSPDSFNPEHEDIIITSGDDHTVEFGGKVVWFQAASEME